MISGGIAGDADGDGDVTVADFESMPECVNGPEVIGDPGCQVFDFDRDDDIDLGDYAEFMRQVN